MESQQRSVKVGFKLTWFMPIRVILKGSQLADVDVDVRSQPEVLDKKTKGSACLISTHQASPQTHEYPYLGASTVCKISQYSSQICPFNVVNTMRATATEFFRNRSLE
jgi:hypothetical protein